MKVFTLCLALLCLSGWWATVNAQSTVSCYAGGLCVVPRTLATVPLPTYVGGVEGNEGNDGFRGFANYVSDFGVECRALGGAIDAPPLQTLRCGSGDDQPVPVNMQALIYDPNSYFTWNQPNLYCRGWLPQYAGVAQNCTVFGSTPQGDSLTLGVFEQSQTLPSLFVPATNIQALSFNLRGMVVTWNVAWNPQGNNATWSQDPRVSVWRVTATAYGGANDGAFLASVVTNDSSSVASLAIAQISKVYSAKVEVCAASSASPTQPLQFSSCREEIILVPTLASSDNNASPDTPPAPVIFPVDVDGGGATSMNMVVQPPLWGGNTALNSLMVTVACATNPTLTYPQTIKFPSPTGPAYWIPGTSLPNVPIPLAWMTINFSLAVPAGQCSGGRWRVQTVATNASGKSSPASAASVFVASALPPVRSIAPLCSLHVAMFNGLIFRCQPPLATEGWTSSLPVSTITATCTSAADHGASSTPLNWSPRLDEMGVNGFYDGDPTDAVVSVCGLSANTEYTCTFVYTDTASTASADASVVVSTTPDVTSLPVAISDAHVLGFTAHNLTLWWSDAYNTEYAYCNSLSGTVSAYSIEIKESDGLASNFFVANADDNCVPDRRSCWYTATGLKALTSYSIRVTAIQTRLQNNVASTVESPVFVVTNGYIVTTTDTQPPPTPMYPLLPSYYVSDHVVLRASVGGNLSGYSCALGGTPLAQVVVTPCNPNQSGQAATCYDGTPDANGVPLPNYSRVIDVQPLGKAAVYPALIGQVADWVQGNQTFAKLIVSSSGVMSLLVNMPLPASGVSYVFRYAWISEGGVVSPQSPLLGQLALTTTQVTPSPPVLLQALKVSDTTVQLGVTLPLVHGTQAINRIEVSRCSNVDASRFCTQYGTTAFALGEENIKTFLRANVFTQQVDELVQLTGLQPNTTHHLQVALCHDDGCSIVSSSTLTVRTLAAAVAPTPATTPTLIAYTSQWAKVLVAMPNDAIVNAVQLVNAVSGAVMAMPRAVSPLARYVVITTDANVLVAGTTYQLAVQLSSDQGVTWGDVATVPTSLTVPAASGVAPLLPPTAIMVAFGGDALLFVVEPSRNHGSTEIDSYRLKVELSGSYSSYCAPAPWWNDEAGVATMYVDVPAQELSPSAYYDNSRVPSAVTAGINQGLRPSSSLAGVCTYSVQLAACNTDADAVPQCSVYSLSQIYVSPSTTTAPAATLASSQPLRIQNNTMYMATSLLAADDRSIYPAQTYNAGATLANLYAALSPDPSTPPLAAAAVVKTISGGGITVPIVTPVTASTLDTPDNVYVFARNNAAATGQTALAYRQSTVRSATCKLSKPSDLFTIEPKLYTAKTTMIHFKPKVLTGPINLGCSVAGITLNVGADKYQINNGTLSSNNFVAPSLFPMSNVIFSPKGFALQTKELRSELSVQFSRYAAFSQPDFVKCYSATVSQPLAAPLITQPSKIVGVQRRSVKTSKPTTNAPQPNTYTAVGNFNTVSKWTDVPLFMLHKAVKATADDTSANAISGTANEMPTNCDVVATRLFLYRLSQELDTSYSFNCPLATVPAPPKVASPPTAINATSFQVSWQPNDSTNDGGSPITNYTVLAKIDANEHNTISTQVAPDASNAIVTVANDVAIKARLVCFSVFATNVYGSSLPENHGCLLI